MASNDKTSNTLSSQQRQERLREWQLGLDPEHPGRSLTEDEIAVIANNPATDSRTIARIPFVSKDLLRKIAPELAKVLTPEPKSTPPPTPSPTPTAPAPNKSESLEELAFAETQISTDNLPNWQHANSHVDGDGKVQISWSGWRGDEPTVIYRVVSQNLDSGDSGSNPGPEWADPVANTRELTLTDDRPMRHATCRYQVWVHAGATVEDAAASQPTAHASVTVVAPVQNPEWSLDEGVVVGRWTSMSGHRRIAVHRSLADEPDRFDPANELLSEGSNKAGFMDPAATPGMTYRYSAYAMATIDGQNHQSEPVTKEFSIPAPLDPVSDLAITLQESNGNTVCSLEWTRPPHGEVRIYRTSEEPQAGINHETLPLDALERAGLSEDKWLKFPAQQDGDRDRLTGVPWPAGWPRAHFTPVTVIDDKGRAGTTHTKVGISGLRDASLVERVDRQVAVFGWPTGAAEVGAYITSGESTTIDPARDSEIANISKDDYARLGGLSLNLDGAQTDLLLVPKAWEGGQLELGEGHKLHYRGLLRLKYEIVSVGGGGRGAKKKKLFGKKAAPTPSAPSGQAVLRLTADRDLAVTPPLSLIHNDRRLPISPKDGRQIASVAQTPLVRGEPKDVWQGDLSSIVGGFVRLFVLPGNRQVDIAVLDPDIETLRRP
jgi:hypothetical protein